MCPIGTTNTEALNIFTIFSSLQKQVEMMHLKIMMGIGSSERAGESLGLNSEKNVCVHPCVFVLTGWVSLLEIFKCVLFK